MPRTGGWLFNMAAGANVGRMRKAGLSDISTSFSTIESSSEISLARKVSGLSRFRLDGKFPTTRASNMKPWKTLLSILEVMAAHSSQLDCGSTRLPESAYGIMCSSLSFDVDPQYIHSPKGAKRYVSRASIIIVVTPNIAFCTIISYIV